MYLFLILIEENDIEEGLPVEEAAYILNVSKNYLYRLIREERLEMTSRQSHQSEQQERCEATDQPTAIPGICCTVTFGLRCAPA